MLVLCRAHSTHATFVLLTSVAPLCRSLIIVMPPLVDFLSSPSAQSESTTSTLIPSCFHGRITTSLVPHPSTICLPSSILSSFLVSGSPSLQLDCRAFDRFRLIARSQSFQQLVTVSVTRLVLQPFLCPSQISFQYVACSAAKDATHLDVMPFAHL